MWRQRNGIGKLPNRIITWLNTVWDSAMPMAQCASGYTRSVKWIRKAAIKDTPRLNSRWATVTTMHSRSQTVLSHVIILFGSFLCHFRCLHIILWHALPVSLAESRSIEPQQHSVRQLSETAILLRNNPVARRRHWRSKVPEDIEHKHDSARRLCDTISLPLQYLSSRLVRNGILFLSETRFHLFV